MMTKCNVASGMESWNRNRTWGQNPGNSNQVQTSTLIIIISMYSLIIITVQKHVRC